MVPRRVLRILLLSCLTGLSALPAAVAQSPTPGPTYPIMQGTMPPGMAGHWAAMLRGRPACFQPVRVILPEGGKVTWFNGSPHDVLTLDAPAQAAILLGPVYRLRISHMPSHPGVELYPTVELLDRLHPPAGREHEYPVPVTFTEQEIEYALQGRLVTKVVYLEQPNIAAPEAAAFGVTTPPALIPASEDPLHVADLRGRPMMIVRLGGRLPAVNEHPSFYGSGAPVLAPGAHPPPEQPVLEGVPHGAVPTRSPLFTEE